jgi:cation diffusion facilitator CzcD-associated flavoprotein CzcO
LIDRSALRAKYRAERDKRLRADGNAQYRRLPQAPDASLDDPYQERIARAPKRDHVHFAFVGGGFGGLIAGARVTEAGVGPVRIVDKAGDFGGAWYWNRYPGAQCDTAAMVYMPLLEETGHMPAEKYAHGPEILEHARRIGRHYGLYEHALFHTQVRELRWDEAASHWIVRTDRGDAFSTRHVGIGSGTLHTPKLPGIPGIESYAGHGFHTSRWDYAYTGGDAHGAPLDRLADKRVAIIGTGATAVQCIPHLAGACKELYVFQRTPSSVDVRDNHPIDPRWFREIATPGWQRRWLENFTANQSGAMASHDLVMDGWTEIARRVRARIAELPAEERSPRRMLEAFEDSDFAKMDQIRARVDAIVQDGATAQALKPWYRQLCKRPCFHDAYLQSFNRTGVRLVDTDGKGVERITHDSVVAGGVAYPVDCIVYASGFEVGAGFVERMGFEVIGRGGRTLSRSWEEGMRSLHGLQVHGFPNLFLSQPTQGANLISNVPHNLVEAGTTMAALVGHAHAHGFSRIEVSQKAEDAWVSLLLSGSRARVIGSPDCTPGYYNNEGQEPSPAAAYWVGYPLGASAFFTYLDQWRSCGDFAGVDFS